MKSINLVACLVLLDLALSYSSAYDPPPLQDFCVATNDTSLGVFVNGKFCKDPSLVTSDDFTFTGLKFPGDTDNPLGALVSPAFADEFPALNTLGISMVRIDYAPRGGINPPHIHPRASELLIVMEGTLYVGFVSSNPNNTVYSKILTKGEVFLFPFGMIHFQMNIGSTPSYAIAALSSQNPGVITVANTIFGSKPMIDPDLLAKAFQLSSDDVKILQTKSWFDNVNFYA
jgi:quercetin dioxygenase-like cupin family protein